VFCAGAIGDASRLSAASQDNSRRAPGVLLALRRLQHTDVANFLSDADPDIVLEAARAINDEPLTSGFRGPRRGLLRSAVNDPLLRRVLNANSAWARGKRQLLAELPPAEKGPRPSVRCLEFPRRVAASVESRQPWLAFIGLAHWS